MQNRYILAIPVKLEEFFKLRNTHFISTTESVRNAAYYIHVFAIRIPSEGTAFSSPHTIKTIREICA
jgi:hypothetical protein